MAKRKKTDDPSQDNLEPQNDADNFGLPDLEYKPLEEEEEEIVADEPVEEEPVKEETTQTQYYHEEEREVITEENTLPEEEESSKAPAIIISIIALVVIVASGLIYWYVYKPKMEAKEKARIELEARQLKEREEAARLAREEEERRRHAADSAANVVVKPTIGEIVTLTERTKRYYVVVTSSIDGDLAMDFAKKLSAKGVSTKIIPPFGKWNFYRLAVGDFESFAEAQASADSSKGEYGDGVWVIKY